MRRSYSEKTNNSVKLRQIKSQLHLMRDKRKTNFVTRRITMEMIKSVVNKGGEFLFRVGLTSYIMVGMTMLCKIMGNVQDFKNVMLATAITILVPVTITFVLFVFFILKESILISKK